MMRLTNVKQLKIFQLWRFNNSVWTVYRLLREYHGQFNYPNERTIPYIVQKFEETESIRIIVNRGIIVSCI